MYRNCQRLSELVAKRPYLRILTKMANTNSKTLCPHGALPCLLALATTPSLLCNDACESIALRLELERSRQFIHEHFYSGPRERVKGQLISKAIYGLLTSPKKRTDEFDLFAFLLFMQSYIHQVLQTIQMKLILLCVWAETAVLGSAKTALKFKYVI